MPTAYFDFDDTLFPGDSILYWKHFYYSRRPFKRYFQIFSTIGIILFVFRLISSDSLKKVFLLPICYDDKKIVRDLAKEFAERVLKPKLYKELLKEVENHINRNHRIVIISASPRFYMKYLDEMLPNLKVIATDMHFPQSGFLRMPTFSSSFGNMKGQSKVEYIIQSDEEPNSGVGCYSYSDSHWDLPLLNFSEFPSVVYPNRKLEKIAKQRKWNSITPKDALPKYLHNLKKFLLFIFH